MVKIKAMKIPGKWREGYALDFHTIRSEFLGYDGFGHPMFDTHRSEIGELLYKLKYQSDRSVVNTLVEIAADFIVSWNPTLNLLVPTPPSRPRRTYQPVLEIAKSLSQRISVPLCVDCIKKVKDTRELKNVYDYDERIQLLENAFSINSSKLKGQNVLLFDDLYRSGATLNAITGAVYEQVEGCTIYVLALTKTRSTS